MRSYNQNYRFQLGIGRTDGRKETCPYCGTPRRFVRYVDTQGDYVFPEFVGRCDREIECGVNYTPQKYFEDHPEEKRKVFGNLPEETWSLDGGHPTRHPAPQPNVNISWQPSFIDEDIVQKSLCRYDINPLYRYLSSVFGSEETMELMQLYRVGTSRLWNGSTVFWQTDISDRVHSGKIMAYDPKTGHRIKTDGAKVCWAHAAMRLADFNLQQCLFGEHLLAKFPDSQVMIVESEKTAVICHHFMPEYVWIATGGKNGCFNSEAMQVLRGRDVTLFPDLKAYDEWDTRLPMLHAICKSASISDYLERIATDEQREQGLDIADFLLMTETPQMILQRMIDRNPAIQLLIDKLKLKIVET